MKMSSFHAPGFSYTCILSVFVIEYVLMHFIRYLKSNGYSLSLINS